MMNRLITRTAIRLQLVPTRSVVTFHVQHKQLKTLIYRFRARSSSGYSYSSASGLGWFFRFCEKNTASNSRQCRQLYSNSNSNLHSQSKQTARLDLLPETESVFHQASSRMNIGYREKPSSMTTKSGATGDDHFVVCVEGNIGCGKTTLLNYFNSVGGCEVLAEPVEQWRNVEGHNVLELMYKDPTRWSMALQTYVQLTMLQSHTKPMTQPIRLMERSIFSAKYCFVENLFNSKLMPEIEYIILGQWFDWIIETQNTNVDLFVYLRTDPELLHQRIMKRCREEEKCIPVEYLKTLHQLHEDWLVNKKFPCQADVLILDANSSLEEMVLKYEQYKDRILQVQEENVCP